MGENIYLRIIYGFFSIFLGVILLWVYRERNKESVWGHIYRLGKGKTGSRRDAFFSGRITIIFGCLAIVAGVIALLFGFRPYMVGR